MSILKSKLFVGVMIVTVMVVGFAAFHNTAAASSCSITSTLRVGSTGAEVTCLQEVVGVTADGKFGPMTKAAVMTWQTSKGLVADGVFGPKSRAVYAAGGSVTTTTGDLCPNGNTLASNCTTAPGSTSAALCPNGNTVASNCATAPGSTVSSTGEGSVTVTYNALPADNMVVNKGETKEVMALKIKATGSDMKVSRLWLDLNARIWLSASDASIWDGSTMLATVALSSDTVLETTVGSAWQLQFNGLSVNVPVGTTKILTVKVTRPTLTSASASIAVASTSSIRATDAAGFTNTYTLSARTINLSGIATATTGTLTATLSGSTPLAQSISGLSTTAGTLTAVRMLDVDLKATDGPINVSLISGTFTNAGTCADTSTTSECIASAELRDGTNVLSSVTGANVFSFGSLNVDIPAGTTKTLSIWVKANHIATSYVVAGDNLLATITAVTATTNGFATSASITPTVAGNIQYFYRYAPSITLGSTTATTTNTSGSISADYSLKFSVTAPAGQDIYVAKAIAASGTDNIVVKTTSGNGGTIADTLTAAIANGTDTTNYYIVIAGSTREFTASAHVPVGGSAGFTGVKLTQVHWNTDGETNAAPVAQTWGLPNYNTASVYVTAS